MKFTFWLLLGLQGFWINSAFSASNPISVALTKSESQQWSVSFTAETQINKLVFRKSPNFSRDKRWTVQNPEYVIQNDGEVEFVTRKDGRTFDEVSFDLTATYSHLPKEYPPFSPFLDGGMLVHTRRYFACAERCPDDIDQWAFSLQAPKSDAIIVLGKQYREQVSWSESGWGSKFYVGETLPIEDDNFIFVIDEKLPAVFKTRLDDALPKITQRLSELMLKPANKPMFFASYSAPENRWGRQGGVLPNQIFAHWYGKNIVDNIVLKEELWFLAHEITHFYQKDVFESEDFAASWIHEGHADFVAGLLTAELFDMQGYFESRLQKAKSDCLLALQGDSTFVEVAQKDYKLGYKCGLPIWHKIHQDINDNNSGVNNAFSIWDAPFKASESNSSRKQLPLGYHDFLGAMTPYLSDDLASDLQKLTSEPNFDAHAFIASID